MSWERNIVLKSPAEIELMQEAGRINALALEEVHRNVAPGVTTASMDKLAEEVIREHGGKPAFLDYPGPYPYPATINASINEVHCAFHIGLDTLKWVVLSRRYNLGGSRVYNEFDVV